MHVVVAGNPGVGKSAILNSLIGSVKFSSGLSYGSGKTKVLHTVRKGGTKYSDTPGLGDTKMRERAADEISKAFQAGGEFKLIFVVLTDAGRVRPADQATIKIILQAIEEVGVDTTFKYSIIVNKCGPKMLEGLEKKENRAKIEIPFQVGRKLKHIGYMPLVPDAIEAEDYLLSSNVSNEYVSFVNHAPVFKLKSNNGLRVKADVYRETAESLAQQLEELYETLQEVQKKKKDPRFWLKLAISMSAREKGVLELFDEIGSRAPIILSLKSKFSS